MKIVDPLAQSFYVTPESGIFVTSVDLFFFSKDAELPVTVQLRPMQLGFPSNQIYPFGEVVVDSKYVSISDDASVPTKVTFDAPIYLEGGKYHVIAIMSNSNDYMVWLSRLGEVDVKNANAAESLRTIVTKQPLSGTIFKSQNGLTWNTSDFDDLKFNLYRASFGVDGSLTGGFDFYNPDLTLGNQQIATLVENPFDIKSRTVRVGIGTTLPEASLPNIGNTIIQANSNANGNFVGYAGSAFGALSIVNSGIGYTPTSGTYTYNGVSLQSLTGSGRNATASIIVQDGSISSATIQNGGYGYTLGDVLTSTSIGNDSLGRNLQISVADLSGVNELLIDEVQGEFITGIANTVRYINDSNIEQDFGGSGANILIDNIIVVNDGLHIKVNHKNHGMHSPTNFVEISDVLSDTRPTKLSSDLSSTENQIIILDNSTNFGSFENVGISSTNPGYMVIGAEIIAYESIDQSGAIRRITRGIDQTKQFSYSKGTPVYKYELNGVSLRRINKVHSLADATVSEPIGLDYYNLKIDVTSSGKGTLLPTGQVDRSLGSSFPKLFFKETKTTGDNQVHATQNIQFDVIKPVVQTMAITGTNILSEIRTYNGTSINGTEIAFLDNGYEKIDLNENNYLDSPRLITSKLNQDLLIQQDQSEDFSGKKSFTLNLRLSTTNTYISPVVDMDRASVILTTNRVNNVITDYVKDERTSTLELDPSAFVYAIDPISLENPATSLKVYLSAYINTYNDVRLFYAIMKDPNENPIYEPFPGYTNLLSSGQVIDTNLNNGLPDKKIPKSDKLAFNSSELPFRDYEFTIDNLPKFKYFSIKIIGSSTSQTYPPRFKQLRVIALA